MSHTMVIAEAGVNHNGDEALALELVDTAHRAGADVVKFQTFKASALVTGAATQAEYQVTNTGRRESQLDMLKRLELSHEAHHRLVERCREHGVQFLSTAFDEGSLDFLTNDLRLEMLKIPSGDLTNAPLMLAFGRTRRRLIVSTGMATLGEVEECLGVLAFGLTSEPGATPSARDFAAAYASETGADALRENVTLLHCTTEYPAPMQEINLRAMDTLRDAFGLVVGYSDHSQGIEVSVAAAARGAEVLEKHFTLDRNMEGPDHKASLEPDELTSLVRAVRNVEHALGGGRKSPFPSEIRNKEVARKSLVAIEPIAPGDTYTTSNLGTKRPGSGISPIRYWEFLGRTAGQAYSPGDLIVD